MQGLLMDARSRTDDWHYAHVGEMLFNFFMVACHLNPREHIRLWHDATGRLAAYSMLGEDPAFDFQVLPEYEWTGIEAEALRWADERLVELRQQDEKLWGGRLVSGSRQDNSQRIAFLEQNGFRQGGEFSEVNMLRRLDDPIPEVELPAGCQVREVAESDIPDRAGSSPRGVAPVDGWQRQRRGIRVLHAVARLPPRPGRSGDRAGRRHRGLRQRLDRPAKRDRGPWSGRRAPGLSPAGLDPCRTAGVFAPDAGTRDGPCMRLHRCIEYACAAAL